MSASATKSAWCFSGNHQAVDAFNIMKSKLQAIQAYENHVLTVCNLYSVVSHLDIYNTFARYTVCLIAAATTP